MTKQYLLTSLKTRLCSTSKSKSNDKYGNIIYVDCEIFPDDTLNTFLDLSLSEFNQTPQFTDFDFSNEKFVRTFTDILVEGATLHAIASQSLIEKGREFPMMEKNLFLDVPKISDLLNSQYNTLLDHHYTKLRNIKEKFHDYKV